MIQLIEGYLNELIQHAKSISPLSANETLRIAEDLSSFVMKDLDKSYYGMMLTFINYNYII